ncbi:hypothetical protein C8Q80DRAFT_737855 [Daedaleopsis nitida]|nr:hypothetical protein C8Q80DRAFT_737855 [Daedaleopsis nitida]
MGADGSRSRRALDAGATPLVSLTCVSPSASKRSRPKSKPHLYMCTPVARALRCGSYDEEGGVPYVPCFALVSNGRHPIASREKRRVEENGLRRGPMDGCYSGRWERCHWPSSCVTVDRLDLFNIPPLDAHVCAFGIHVGCAIRVLRAFGSRWEFAYSRPVNEESASSASAETLVGTGTRGVSNLAQLDMMCPESESDGGPGNESTAVPNRIPYRHRE